MPKPDGPVRRVLRCRAGRQRRAADGLVAAAETFVGPLSNVTHPHEVGMVSRQPASQRTLNGRLGRKERNEMELDGPSRFPLQPQ